MFHLVWLWFYFPSDIWSGLNPPGPSSFEYPFLLIYLFYLSPGSWFTPDNATQGLNAYLLFIFSWFKNSLFDMVPSSYRLDWLIVVFVIPVKVDSHVHRYWSPSSSFLFLSWLFHFLLFWQSELSLTLLLILHFAVVDDLPALSVLCWSGFSDFSILQISA